VIINKSEEFSYCQRQQKQKKLLLQQKDLIPFVETQAIPLDILFMASSTDRLRSLELAQAARNWFLH